MADDEPVTATEAALERQNEKPEIGTEAEMRAKWLEEQMIHEAVLRAVGQPIATGDPEADEADADEEVDDLDTDPIGPVGGTAREVR